MEKLTAKVILEYQKRCEKTKTAIEFKKLGRELRDRFGLTDREAIDLLNNRDVLSVMASHE